MAKINPIKFFVIINIIETVPIILWIINFSLFCIKYTRNEAAKMNFYICLSSFITFLLINIYTFFLLRTVIIKQVKIHTCYVTIYIILIFAVQVLYVAFNLTLFTFFMIGIQLCFIFCTIGLIGRYNKKNNECETDIDDSIPYFYNPELPNCNDQYQNRNGNSDDENSDIYTNINQNKSEIDDNVIEKCEEKSVNQRYPIKIYIEEDSIIGVTDYENPYSFANREIF